MIRNTSISILLAILSCVFPVRADQLVFQYEGDVRPDDPGAGFTFADPCTEFRMCADFVEKGRYVIEWASLGGDVVNHSRTIAGVGEEPPATLWIEWRFRSNLARVPAKTGCDGRASMQFRNIVGLVWLHGDSTVEFGEAQALFGLEVNQFYTLRFESIDGTNYYWAIDGLVFAMLTDPPPGPGASLVQFGGSGDCTRPSGTILRNEWDFLRYGTLSDGEAIVASDPPEGIVSANELPDFDRFIVSFDRPGFVYTSDITVETTGGDPPAVLWVRRPDGSGPETVQIVLDRPLPLGMTTRFTFNTGGSPNTVEYTYLPLGACCVADGSCVESVREECDLLGGGFVPGASCPGPSACCLADGSCIVLDPVCCEIEGDPPESSLGKEGDCEGDADFDGLDGACGDECPFDPDKTEPGQCGCDEPDTDSDLDTVADCLDVCPDEDDRIDENNDGIPDCRQFQPIPTTTPWGLVILALLLVAAAKVGSIRRRAQT